MMASCAACRFMRRRCQPECVFASGFPASNMVRFELVHRVFGASIVQRLLAQLRPEQRPEAADSLVYEADARVRDPIHGCVRYMHQLQDEWQQIQRQLHDAKKELSAYVGPVASSPSLPQPCHPHRHLQGTPPCSTTACGISGMSTDAADRSIRGIIPGAGIGMALDLDSFGTSTPPEMRIGKGLYLDTPGTLRGIPTTDTRIGLDPDDLSKLIDTSRMGTEMVLDLDASSSGSRGTCTAIVLDPDAPVTSLHQQSLMHELEQQQQIMDVTAEGEQLARSNLGFPDVRIDYNDQIGGGITLAAAAGPPSGLGLPLAQPFEGPSAAQPQQYTEQQQHLGLVPVQPLQGSAAAQQHRQQRRHLSPVQPFQVSFAAQPQRCIQQQDHMGFHPMQSTLGSSTLHPQHHIQQQRQHLGMVPARQFQGNYAARLEQYIEHPQQQQHLPFQGASATQPQHHNEQQRQHPGLVPAQIFQWPSAVQPSHYNRQQNHHQQRKHMDLASAQSIQWPSMAQPHHQTKQQHHQQWQHNQQRRHHPGLVPVQPSQGPLAVQPRHRHTQQRQTTVGLVPAQPFDGPYSAQPQHPQSETTQSDDADYLWSRIDPSS
ncbi:hypothetical protein MUK42_10394 [Musa troglodytarum]|uniref:LOB domain-containing protein n=1 Tax=Musa troglodytarum TaxID=320322 RepID=A0A9E7GQ62_9LILI|nr:hypothetical protein MUK42_10394 [Musa troglodytarum]